MPLNSAQTVSARRRLLFLVVFLAAFSVYLAGTASSETYFNGLFASNEPGGGMSIHGMIDKVVSGARSKTGQQLDFLDVTYNIGSVLPPFHERIVADESISRTLHSGDSVPLRIWGDGPEFARVDVPSETARYDRIARDHAIAAAISLGACLLCGWGWSRMYRQSGIKS